MPTSKEPNPPQAEKPAAQTAPKWRREAAAALRRPWRPVTARLDGLDAPAKVAATLLLRLDDLDACFAVVQAIDAKKTSDEEWDVWRAAADSMPERMAAGFAWWREWLVATDPNGAGRQKASRDALAALARALSASGAAGAAASERFAQSLGAWPADGHRLAGNKMAHFRLHITKICPEQAEAEWTRALVEATKPGAAQGALAPWVERWLAHWADGESRQETSAHWRASMLCVGVADCEATGRISLEKARELGRRSGEDFRRSSHISRAERHAWREDASLAVAILRGRMATEMIVAQREAMGWPIEPEDWALAIGNVETSAQRAAKLMEWGYPPRESRSAVIACAALGEAARAALEESALREALPANAEKDKEANQETTGQDAARLAGRRL
jgi:hypothetical protein